MNSVTSGNLIADHEIAEALQNRMSSSSTKTQIRVQQRKPIRGAPVWPASTRTWPRSSRPSSARASYLLSQQHPDGYWCGELEADSMLEADYIFLHTLLESGDPGRLQRALTEMMRYQNEDGSWSIYPGGPGNISLSVKCYFSAKLMGIGADDPRLAKCREWILAHGGVVACNTFTKMYLCALGQYDYDAVPAIPPEIVLFPNWFYFNIYEISSWSRSILVPLAIIYAKKPFKKIPPEQGIDELFVGGRANSDPAPAHGPQAHRSPGAISSSSSTG